METLEIINGYNEANGLLQTAKQCSLGDAMAIYSKIYRIQDYINGQINVLLKSYAE